MRCIWLKSDSQQANFNYYFNNVTYITNNFLFSFQTHHRLSKTPAPVHSISTWPPPNLWSVSYTTCRSSPDQRGMAMVRRRRVQGAGTEGRSQSSTRHGWYLSSPNGRRLIAPLPPSWAVLGLFLRGLSNGKGERQEMGNAKAGTELQWWQGCWVRTRTEGQGEEPQQPTMRVRGKVVPTITQGPLEVAAQEPSKKPAPSENRRHCCWTSLAIPKY